MTFLGEAVFYLRGDSLFPPFSMLTLVAAVPPSVCDYLINTASLYIEPIQHSKVNGEHPVALNLRFMIPQGPPTVPLSYCL